VKSVISVMPMAPTCRAVAIDPSVDNFTAGDNIAAYRQVRTTYSDT